MRTVNPTLTAALAAGTGIPYRVGTIGYIGAGVIYSGEAIAYKLTGQSLEMELAYNGDLVGDQQAIWLERGVTIQGTKYSLTTGKFYIHSQHYLPNGHQVIKAGLFPKQYYSAAGDVTYKTLIDAFCTYFGKTAIYRDPAAAWLNYQFFPAGKSLIMNDANYIGALLQQKYLIFFGDNGNEQITFYSADAATMPATNLTINATNSYYLEVNNLKNRLYMWRDEAGTVHSDGTVTDPIHNLGYLESTAAPPARHMPGVLAEVTTRPDLRPVDGDVIQLNAMGVQAPIYAQLTEQYIAPTKAHPAPRWELTVHANEIFQNTAGGALPSTMERISNYTPLNTSQFNHILSPKDNNLQAAMDTLDEHKHYVLQGLAAVFDPADGATYYFGSMPNEPPQTTGARCRLNIPRAGTITGVRIHWLQWGGVNGSGETITYNILVNNTDRYLIGTASTTNPAKGVSNLALSIPTGSSYIELEIVCPTWATNPTQVRLAAVIYIE